MSVDLSIIIVNWNGIEFLPACLKSIVENPPTVSFEIVLVDNDSSDASVARLKSDEAEKLLGETAFTLVESRENLGLGRANNLAIEKSGAPFVFLLNPDTLVKPQAIDRLLETLRADAKIGLVAPKLLNADETLQANAWAIPGAARTLVEGFRLQRLVPPKYRRKWLLSGAQNYQETRDVPLVSGAAMLVKRELIETVGAFDKQIFMYGEDAEWCVRIGRGGWRIVLEPAAEIVHLGGQSAMQMWGAGDTRMKEEEAFLKFQQDCFSPFRVLRNTFARIFVLSVYFVSTTLRGRPNDHLKNVISLQIKGFSESLRKLF